MNATYHLRQPPSSDDVSGMHKTVQVPCTLLNLLAHIVVHVHIEDVRDDIQGILIVLYFGIQTRQVEAICEVVFVDFAEVFVSS